MDPATTQSFIQLEPPETSLPEIQLAGTELLPLIRDAISMVQKLPARAEDSLLDGKPCPPKSLLSLLTLCYVQGIYGSLQIQERIRTDEVLRLASGGCLPDHHVLNRFRRHNRDAIQHCVKWVYWFIWVKYGIQRREFLLAIDDARSRRVRVSPQFSTRVEADAAESVSHAVMFDHIMADE